MMIAYRKTGGLAHDIRFVSEDYQPVEGEFVVPGEALPSAGGLSDVSALLEQARAIRVAEIRSACRAAIEAGVESNVLGAMHHYPLASVDQQNMAALVLNVQIAGATYSAKFWCADGAAVWARRLHTAAQLTQLGQEMTVHVQAQQDHYEALLAQIAAAQTAGEIEAVTW